MKDFRIWLMWSDVEGYVLFPFPSLIIVLFDVHTWSATTSMTWTHFMWTDSDNGAIYVLFKMKLCCVRWRECNPKSALTDNLHCYGMFCFSLLYYSVVVNVKTRHCPTSYSKAFIVQQCLRKTLVWCWRESRGEFVCRYIVANHINQCGSLCFYWFTTQTMCVFNRKRQDKTGWVNQT